MKTKPTAKTSADYAPAFIEGQDEDDHYSILGNIEVAAIIDCQDPIHCCKFNPTGDMIAVGLTDGTIKMYDKSHQNQLVYVLADDDVKNTRMPVTSLRFFNPPNDPNMDHYKILVASYVAGFVKFWHYPSKSCIYTIRDKLIEPLSVDLNSRCDRMAIGGYHSEIHVYDLPSKKLVSTLESSESAGRIDGHSNRVLCVKYNGAIPNQLLSGGWDDTVQIWDDRIAQSQSYIYGPHVCGEAIDIDTRHNHVLTGSWRKFSTLQIWDLRNNQMIRDTFKAKANMMIYGCHWMAESYIFTGGSEKNAAVVYDRGTLKPMCGLHELKHAVTSIANDGIGEFPSLLVAARNSLYVLQKKTEEHRFAKKKSQA